MTGKKKDVRPFPASASSSSGRMRPSADTIGPRFVYDSLVRAESELVNAHKATEDNLIAGELAKARKHLRAATSRAHVYLKAVSLRTAPQAGLFDPTQTED